MFWMLWRYLCSLPLSFSLNSDESAAMGAAFTAARFSPSFRVETFDVEDLVDATIHLFADSGEGFKLGLYVYVNAYMCVYA